MGSSEGPAAGPCPAVADPLGGAEATVEEEAPTPRPFEAFASLFSGFTAVEAFLGGFEAGLPALARLVDGVDGADGAAVLPFVLSVERAN